MKSIDGLYSVYATHILGIEKDIDSLASSSNVIGKAHSQHVDINGNVSGVSSFIISGEENAELFFDSLKEFLLKISSVYTITKKKVKILDGCTDADTRKVSVRKVKNEKVKRNKVRKKAKDNQHRRS